MSLHWMGELCVVTIVILEFLVHLFLERRFAYCSLRFSRLPSPLCTLLWQNWGKMAQAAEDKNAAILQKWAFCEEDCIPDTPERSERLGGTATFSKAKSKAFAKSVFSNSF